MQNRSTITHAHKYRPPHVGRVTTRHDISSGKEDAEEEEEWSDDSDSRESSNPLHREAPAFNSHHYDGNFDDLQNRMSMIDTSLGVLLGLLQDIQTCHRILQVGKPSHMGSPIQLQILLHRIRDKNTILALNITNRKHHISPLPPQSYPSVYPEVESIRQELEAMKIESREKDRKIEKQRAEELRRKKRRAELQQQRRKAKRQETQKIAFEIKEQIQADIDKRLESVSEATKHRDPTADLYGILSNFLPPNPSASHYGHGYGYNAQDKYAHDISMIMRKLDSLAALEQQAPPARWFDGQGPPIRYHNHNDRLVIDDLRNQIDEMKWYMYGHGKRIGTLLPYQQPSAGQFFDGGYHLPYGPGYPTFQPPYSLAASSGSNHPAPMEPIEPSRRPRVGVHHGRRSPPNTAVFSGFEEPTESVDSRRKNYNFRRYANDDDDNGYPKGESLPSTAVADLVDGNQQVLQNTSRKVREKQRPPRKKPEVGENKNATRVVDYGNHSVAAQQADTDRGEYDVDPGHWSDTSDEEYRHQSNIYVVRPESRFRREVLQTKDRHTQPPFDQFPYGAEDSASRVLAPSPPLAADEDVEVRPRSNLSTY
ncbi:hypothetical protein GQX73_g9555 [Xylaria multiplex]|uniref:Uncharacterized protein n=1 Tax=Xylaria multiplex TaxID=323545 RepID=A0A7C8MYL2_9PEZI|nr:hypothetical protein GQX73_g9555 [Xylaria multiplex]